MLEIPYINQHLLLIIIAVFLGASACSSTPNAAPITDAAKVPLYKIRSHEVAKGETLYSIAWRYDLDYKALARANGLGQDYRIWPGQRLSLDLSKPFALAVKPAKASKAKLAGKKKPAKRLVKSTAKAAAPNKVKRANSSVSWVWPAAGPLLSKFDEKGGLNKGIDIGGKLGEPVVAAANGDVVYSGSGLRGYGKLLIVKHSEKILSAYAHNRVLHVAEGDKVKAGQKIAQVGHSAAQVAKLHFEIRFDGTPVNPLSYLPSR